jgi:GAF domain-containing protein
VLSSQDDALSSARRSIQAEIHTRHAALSGYRLQAVSPFSLEQTIAEGASLTARMLKAERCTVARLIEGREALLLYAGIGWQAGVVGRAHLAAGTGTLGGYALEHHGPVIVEDLTLNPDFAIDPLLAKHGTVSALVVPIWLQSGPYGILGVYSSVRRLFSPLDLEFVQGMVDVIRAAEYRERWRPGWPLPGRREMPPE